MPELRPHRLALEMVGPRAVAARPHDRANLLSNLRRHLGGHPRHD